MRKSLRFILICILSNIIFSQTTSGTVQKRRTSISVSGEKFLINGIPTFKGKTWRGYTLEGLLPNSRMVQGIFDDLNKKTRHLWNYPDSGLWDADRNSDDFVREMANWRKKGLLAFTINLQGGSPQGYSNDQPWENSAIDASGNLRPDYMNRLERILDQGDKLGMITILGLFYFGQDERIKDETAVKLSVKNVLKWLSERRYTNVLIEINNECNVKYDHPILQPERIHELIKMVKNFSNHGIRYLVSTSYGGGTIPSPEVIKTADFILVHGNGVGNPVRIIEMVKTIRKAEGYAPKPIVFNEDDHFDFDKPMNNFIAATSIFASWGFFDYRMKEEGFIEGYQSVPVDWGINSVRKKGFFDLLERIFVNSEN